MLLDKKSKVTSIKDVGWCSLFNMGYSLGTHGDWLKTTMQTSILDNIIQNTSIRLGIFCQGS